VKHRCNNCNRHPLPAARITPAQAAARIWGDIRSGAAEAEPSLLSRFFVLAFGDLKRYIFTYWWALSLKPPTVLVAVMRLPW
jgi:hypothetical protein